ncbi:MAG: hypothetical protein IJK28_02400 [Clostridia bacterium]|nr:hypothetical protein [Clostridia bacterium]
MKKLCLLVLACLLAVFVLPACAEMTEEGIEYRVDRSDGCYWITGCDEALTDPVIPSQIGYHPVFGIAAGAFEGRADLTSVTLPDSLIAVAERAFAGCTGLRTVRFVRSEIAPEPEGGIRNLSGELRTLMVSYLARRRAWDLDPEVLLYDDINPYRKPLDPATLRETLIADREAGITAIQSEITAMETQLANPALPPAKAKALNRRLGALRKDLEEAAAEIGRIRDHAVLVSEVIADWERDSGLRNTPENASAIYALWREDFGVLKNARFPAPFRDGEAFVRSGAGLQMLQSEWQYMLRLYRGIVPGPGGVLCLCDSGTPGIDATTFEGCGELTVSVPAGSPAAALLEPSGIPFITEP